MIEELSNRIAAALAETHAVVREQNRLSWEVQSEAAAGAVRLRTCDDWLLLEAPLAANAGAAATAGLFLPEALVRWNATLPGGAKFGVDAQFHLTVRAAVPLIEDIDPGPRALEALHGVLAGMTRFASSAPQQTAAPSRAAAIDRNALAGETGWAFTERDDGGVRVWVPLAELAGLSTPSRHALAVLLLRVGAVPRLARPAFVTEGATTSAGLEVDFATTPVGPEMIQALESLAVGVGMAAWQKPGFSAGNRLPGSISPWAIGPRGGWETTTTTNSERTHDTASYHQSDHCL